MVFALLLPSPPAQGQDALGAEEAAEFARRTAFAALHPPQQKIFLESIDADGILRRLLGGSVWDELTPRQQALLRPLVREQFARALAPPRGTPAEVVWASVATPAAAPPISVDLGLRYGTAILKTRWTVQRTPRGWTIEDIILVDPGISLSAEVGRLFAAAPVRLRDTAREARARALPRVLVLVALAAIIVVFRPRLPRERRLLLWLLAGVPALLFAIDGILAVRRTLSERYALSETRPEPPWSEFENAARQAQREGQSVAARAAWTRAMESGSPKAPIEYQMGLAARAAGDNATARADFERALAEDPPAPGAGKELAAMALAEGKPQEARRLLEDYIRAAGPDPETLSALAVAEANAGDNDASARTIAAARALLPEDTRRAELESQVYARAGNAAAAVAALRPLESRGRLDRSALRSDPAYLPIATDPVWVAFLAETPSAPGPVKRPPSASSPRTTPPG